MSWTSCWESLAQQLEAQVFPCFLAKMECHAVSHVEGFGCACWPFAAVVKDLDDLEFEVYSSAEHHQALRI